MKLVLTALSFALTTSFALLTLSGCASTKPPIAYKSPQDWVNQSKAGSDLPLAATPNEWSAAKNFKAETGSVDVRSKFVKHFGTTCVYEVEYKNAGKKKLEETSSLINGEQHVSLDTNNTLLFLKPGEVQVAKLEARECPLDKWSDSTKMNHCAACKTRVGFKKKD